LKDKSDLAVALYKEAKELKQTPSDDVILYSGNAYLSKEAAVKALSNRFHVTKDQNFVKIASQLGKYPNHEYDADTLVKLADVVNCLDLLHGLNFKGHNFYKEAFFVKEAALKSSMNVRLCGKDIPYESIERVGKSRISSYVGKDVAKEMDSGPANFKKVLETLPLDLQRVVHNLTKNV